MNRKAEEFDQIAREVFAPIYPVIAEQILGKTGIRHGLCLDLGCGSGYLGLAIARLSTLNVCLMDNDPEMLKIAQRNLIYQNMDGRVELLPGDVHEIPLDDGSVQLAVSRGSLFFWKNQAKAFREIHRVLAPDGMACVGGGFGTPELKRQIDREMQQRNPEWLETTRQRIGADAFAKFSPLLSEAGIDNYDIEQGPAAMWIVFGRNKI